MALQTRIMKTIEYSLPALTLTKGQCNYIIALILTGGLNGIGICRNLPRVVVYAPLTTQGVGVTCIHTKCYVEDQISNGHDPNQGIHGEEDVDLARGYESGSGNRQSHTVSRFQEIW